MNPTDRFSILLRRGAGVVAAVLALSAVAVPPAGAAPIARATYTGTASGGAEVAFTVSADGTLVISYSISAAGSTCQYDAAGQAGDWQGAPIVGGAFHYRLSDAILFRGSFSGSRSASGTFRLFHPAVGGTQPCDTGVVRWSATTNAASPSGRSPAKHTVATSVDVRQASSALLTGQISAARKQCRASRTVILWNGLRRVASTRSEAGGTYSFADPALWSGHSVRVSVTARTVRGAACAAGSSIFIQTS